MGGVVSGRPRSPGGGRRGVARPVGGHRHDGMGARVAAPRSTGRVRRGVSLATATPSTRNSTPARPEPPLSDAVAARVTEPDTFAPLAATSGRRRGVCIGRGGHGHLDGARCGVPAPRRRCGDGVGPGEATRRPTNRCRAPRRPWCGGPLDPELDPCDPRPARVGGGRRDGHDPGHRAPLVGEVIETVGGVVSGRPRSPGRRPTRSCPPRRWPPHDGMGPGVAAVAFHGSSRGGVSLATVTPSTRNSTPASPEPPLSDAVAARVTEPDTFAPLAATSGRRRGVVSGGVGTVTWMELDVEFPAPSTAVRRWCGSPARRPRRPMIGVGRRGVRGVEDPSIRNSTRATPDPPVSAAVAAMGTIRSPSPRWWGGDRDGGRGGITGRDSGAGPSRLGVRRYRSTGR